MAEAIIEQQLGGAMELKCTEGLGNSELNTVVKAIRDLSELKTAGSIDDLDQIEKTLFGKRDLLWDEKSMMVTGFNEALKEDEVLTPTQKGQVEQGIRTLTTSLQSNDLVRAANQLQTVWRSYEQITGSEKRALELLSSAAELIVAKWRFGGDRELMERLTALGKEDDIGLIEKNLGAVKDATETIRKRDKAGDRADVEGKERQTREAWYTEKWKSINNHQYDRETSSTKFIREEIKGKGGVEEKGNKLDEKHKFGKGMEEMANWRFFKRGNLNDAYSQDQAPDYLKESLGTIKRVAKWIDQKGEAKYLPRMDELKRWTVGGVMTREVWRAIQDNVRTGLTLLENDVTGDILRCRPDQSLTPKIIENKAKGVFEYAVNPEERKQQLDLFSKLQEEVGHSFKALESRQEKLQKTGIRESGAIVVRDKTGKEHGFSLDLRSEVFNPMFLIEDGKSNFGGLEYQAWLARSRLQLLVHTSLDIHEPLHEVGVQGASLWAYLEGMVALSGKPWVPDVLKTEIISRFPGQADFWLLQFWLNQGKDVVVGDVKQLPDYKQGAAKAFREVVVKAYYAPAKGKRIEAGVWLDHSKPISPTIYKLRVKNLEEGRMIWEETGRPTMVNLWYYALYATWEATTHFTEYGAEEYKIWLQSHGQDHSNPIHYIQGFPAFFSEKLAAGLALPLLPDLVYSSQGMLSELYPLVKRDNGEYEIIEGGDELEEIPQGELVRTFREEMKEARQEYIFMLLPVLETEIFQQIQLLLQGAEVTSTKMGRKILASNIFELMRKNIFTKHVTQAWCGANEFYKRRVVTIEKGKTETQTIENMPIDIDLVAVFERTERINEQQGAALILTGVPNEVINVHLPKVLFGRRAHDPSGKDLKEIERLGQFVYGKDPQYSKILEAIATGATAEEIGKAFGNKSQQAERLVGAIMMQLYRRFAGIYDPASFYDITLFTWAKEVTGWFEPLNRPPQWLDRLGGLGRWFKGSFNSYKFLKQPYLADIEIWEEVATWEFKTGPRKGQRIFYHPSFDPRDTGPYDAFFYEGLQASGLTRYKKEGEKDAIWEGGDLVLTLAADSLFRLKSFENNPRRKHLMYTEIGRFSPSMPIDLSNSMWRYGQVHNKLKALNGFRPGVDYGLVPKPREIRAILESNFFELNPDQVNEADTILNGPWPWLRRELGYAALDFLVGQPDPIQKFLEGFKKEAGGLTGGSQAANLLLNSAISPFPQFRATPISAPIAIATGLAVAASPFFTPVWAAAAGVFAGLYAFNLSGRAIQWLFAGGLELGLNYVKHMGGVKWLKLFFRELPDGKRRALQRTPALLGGPLFSQLVEIGNKHSVFWNVMQEKDLAARREKAAQLAGAILEDKITSN